MKKLLIVMSIFLSFQASAAKVSFTYFGNEAGRNSFYSCSYVESQAEYYLKLFGAENIELYCRGGITSWSMMPVSLDAKFDLPTVMGKVETVELRGDNWSPACGLNTMMIREFLKVMNNVEVLKKSDHCAFADSNFYYSLKINL